jgi:hypothetical protein
MGKTIADALREEGEKRGRKKGEKVGELRAMRRTLLRQLRERFGDLPAETEATIKGTDNVQRLEDWLSRFASTRKLEDVGIGSPS